MDPLYVAAVGIAGAAVGAAIDPVGQHLARRSREADDRRRAEQEARATEAGTADEGNGAHGDLAPAPPPPVRHLLPSGHSTARTGGAAVVTGVLWAATAHRFGPHLRVTPFLVFMALAVAVSVTDLSYRLVPRRLLFGALALIVPLLVIVSAVEHDWGNLGTAAIAGAAAFGVFFVIWFIVPRGLGYGDVRLAGVIGITVGYLGLVHAYVAFLSGFVLGLLFGLVFMIGSGQGRKTYIPFAPALCAGAVLAILWTGSLFDSLLHGS